jgi:hypothetical protein
MKIIRHFGHRTPRDAVARVEAEEKIMRKRIGIPMHRRRRSSVQSIGSPALGLAAGKVLIRFFRTKKIARRVAGTAMAETFDKIGAAIPCRVMQFVRRRYRPHRLARHQIGVDRFGIVIGDAREMVIGKGRIKISAVAPHAIAQRTLKRRLRPVPDSGMRVRSDIGRIDRAKGRRQRAATREPPSAYGGVANIAIAERCKLGAAFKQIWSETIGRRRRNRVDRRLSRGNEKSA